LRAQVLVDRLEVGGVARLEIVAAGGGGDALQYVLVQAHAHGPTLEAERRAVHRAHADGEYPHAVGGRRLGGFRRIDARIRLAVREPDDGEGVVRSRRHGLFLIALARRVLPGRARGAAVEELLDLYALLRQQRRERDDDAAADGTAALELEAVD